MSAWANSLSTLAVDLSEANLGDVEVLISYRLPHSSHHVDVVLVGQQAERLGPSYVLLNIKPWQEATLFEDNPKLVLQSGTRGRPSLHPVAQVHAQCEYLRSKLGYADMSADPVSGAAYLHNASDDSVHALRTYPQDRSGQLFTALGRARFLDYLRSRLSPINADIHADRLLRSSFTSCKRLLSVAAEEFHGRPQFIFLNEQLVAFNLVLHEATKAQSVDHKSVVVISGGPGSGKSAVALSLLGELNLRGLIAAHVTGSRSFTQTLRRVISPQAPRVAALFKYFNQFIDAPENGLDVLIADEAHRLRKTSVNRWTRPELNTGKRQVDEIIDAARLSVFLLDQDQVVRPGETGTLEEIEDHARARGIPVSHVALDGQYRSGGDPEYVNWVDRLLGLTAGRPAPWTGNADFELKLASSPSALEAMLADRVVMGQSARIAAGYCWPWSDPLPDGSLVPDVRIGEWMHPWALKGDRSVGGAPPAALWASDDRGFGQVGTVYSAQGFDYEWSGVLVGPDLVWRNDDWVTVRQASMDPDFKNLRRVSDADFDVLVRNVYKVLLTRGLRGTILYSTDEETQEFLKTVVR
ncbi:DUF2075 domain-containing protein [Modestobacter marinus]|uniref:AAA+ ATPase domain-containing protein n=2 Tax=Modestobacter marinus TaxID=477641 RepID=A0A846LM82_9ACTN|nr:DUF2075 domain-containing protein [Modestobacter marinus]NIH66438.1 hypothetical protein [Modestobacter marinus]